MPAHSFSVSWIFSQNGNPAILGGATPPTDGTYMIDSYGNLVKDSYGNYIPLPPGKTD